jgi:RNA polymerase sigma-70 factor (ECF subfamily)
VLEARRGDQECFEELVRRHHARIRQYCRQLTSDPGLGDDAAQEAFLKAFQRLDSFRGEAKFTTWLICIARNACIDLLRGRGRRFEEIGRGLQSDDAPEPRVEEDLAARIEARNLSTRILGGLSAPYREVILLREIHDMSYEDMVETLGISLDAVKGRLKRARDEIFRLIEALEGEHHG